MKRLVDLCITVAAILIVWQLLHMWAGDVALTSPGETIAFAVKLLGTARFWPNVAETGIALGWSLLLASLGGLALGVLLGIHRLSGEVAEPILVALYAIPKVTLYPLVLLLFGLGLPAKVAFGAMHGVIPVAIFAMGAVRGIRPVHLKTARVMGLSTWAAARHVWLPAALPEIIAGQRVGFSLTLLGVLIGEMFASQRGLGFLIMNAIGLNDVPTIMAITLLLALVAISVNLAFLALARRLNP